MKILDLLEQSASREVYHFTRRANMDSVRKNGIELRSSQFKGIKHDQDSIFVVTQWDEEVFAELMTMLAQKEPSSPVEWSDRQWDAFYDSYIMVVIDTNKIPGIVFHKDPNSESYQNFAYTITAIPASAIKMILPCEW